MVCEETPFVAAHAEMVDEQRVADLGVLGDVKGPAEGGEELRHVPVELADLAGYGANRLGLVRREVRE